jgi:hypothetical protein
MNGLYSAEPQPCGHAIRGIAFVLAMGFAACVTWSAAATAQDVAARCADPNPMSENFLACVRGLLEGKSTAQAVLAEPLRGRLGQLAQAQGYRGAAGDLDELKRRSTELKGNPAANRDAINVLDSAIASHADEIRPAISIAELAKKSSPGTNIHPLYVKQKLDFLSSGKLKFYDGGPYEITWRSLLANALEETYFLELAAGKSDPSLLHREIKLVDEILNRHTQPEFGYLPASRRNLQINSHLFWRASLLFVLGEKSQLRDMLSSLAVKNRQFSLETTNSGHVYVYRALDLPYQMIVQPGVDKDGAPKIEMAAQNLIRRYYNPAQLALATCAHIENAGPKGVSDFVATVNDLVLTDYYVIAGSADNSEKLQQLDAAIGAVLNGDKLRAERDRVLEIVAGQGGAFPTLMEQGARLCGVDAAVRDDIYSPFRFRSAIKHMEEPGNKYSDYLLFGGRLNAAQANTVSEFLNKAVHSTPEVRSLQEKLGIDGSAHIARMRIDE